MQTVTPPAGAAEYHPTRHTFTADEYRRMGEIGVLREDDRVELIEGEILRMAALGWQHITCVTNLNMLLVKAVGADARVNVQSSIALDPRTEPQPDIAIVRHDPARRALASARDVLLLIEVSDTTLHFDRTVKLPLYASAGVPEVWIVDLRGRAILRFRNPQAGGYTQEDRCTPGQTVQPALLPNVDVLVAEIFADLA